MNSPFWHYNALFEPQALIRQHAAADVPAIPDRFVNYFGVAIDPRFFPSILGERVGEVEQETIPRTGMPTSRSSAPHCARSSSPRRPSP